MLPYQLPTIHCGPQVHSCLNTTATKYDITKCNSCLASCQTNFPDLTASKLESLWSQCWHAWLYNTHYHINFVCCQTIKLPNQHLQFQHHLKVVLTNLMIPNPMLCGINSYLTRYLQNLIIAKSPVKPDRPFQNQLQYHDCWVNKWGKPSAIIGGYMIAVLVLV